MGLLQKKKLTIATLVYWFLLVYIITALVWWFIALQQQNRQMTLYKMLELKADDPAYLHKIDKITQEEKRKTTLFVSEGITFLLLILVSAVFVYRAVRRQIKSAHQQQNFMMAVTHELKTPIAVARLNLETLQRHKLEEQKQHKIIQMTLQEVNRLNTLANNILVSAQLESGSQTISKDELDISTLVLNSVQDFRNRFPGRNWKDEIEHNSWINGDPLLLEILVNNLIENAVKYSPKESTITIKLLQNSRRITLEVADEGPGIPEEERKKIFERFYRIGNEEVRKTKGTGLGLYLCKKIAQDHNADIVVTNNHPVGSIFTVHFTL